MSVNICRTCKHFRPDRTFHAIDLAIKYGACAHPTAQTIDVVSGKVHLESASMFRKPSLFGRTATCGPDGIFYELEPSDWVRLQRELGPWTVMDVVNVIVILCVIAVLRALKKP